MITVEQNEEEARHHAVDEGEHVVECTEIAHRLRAESFGVGIDSNRSVVFDAVDRFECERRVQWTLLFELHDARADDQRVRKARQTDESDEEEKGNA